MTEEQIDKIIKAITDSSQNNTISIVLQVATVLISVISIVVASIISVRSIRSQKYVEIIARQRLEDYNNIRKYLSEFIAIASISFNNIKEEYLESFEKAYYNLICNFKPQYDEDKQIIETMESIRAAITQKNPSTSNQQILCTELLQKVTAYNAANWECIKQETGKTHMNHENFKKYYTDSLKKK